MAVSVGHVTPRQTSEREFDAPSRAVAINYARSDAHATPISPMQRFSPSPTVFYAARLSIFPPFFFIIIVKGRSSFTSAVMRFYIICHIVYNKIKLNIEYDSFFFIKKFSIRSYLLSSNIRLE